MFEQYDTSTEFRVQVIRSLNLLVDVEKTQSTKLHPHYETYLVPISQWLWNIAGRHWNNSSNQRSTDHINSSIQLLR